MHELVANLRKFCNLRMNKAAKRLKVDVDYETQNQLSNFFLEELYHNYSDNSGQDYPGFFGKLEWDAQPCYLINSHEEFLSAYKGLSPRH